MDDPRAWEDPVELIPLYAAALAAPIEATGIQILPQTSAIATDSKILEVATEMLLHILHHGATAVRPQDIESHAKFLQLLTYPFALSLATHHEATATTSRNEVREAKKIEGLRPT